jgi:hypothetical protein
VSGIPDYVRRQVGL